MPVTEIAAPPSNSVNVSSVFQRVRARDINITTYQLHAGLEHTPGRVVVGEIPQTPTCFVTRAQSGQLRDALRRSRVAVVVTGMRGVGKTQLAASLAREECDTGEALVGWINAETLDTAYAGMSDIAEQLGVADPDGDSAVSARRLRNHLSGRDAVGLLVFDNAVDADGIRPLLPVGGGTRVVVTTTDRSFAALGEPVNLDVFTRVEAARYLCEATGLTDESGAEQVAADLGDLPLALSAAAATITGRRLDYDRYRQLLSQRSLPNVLARKAGHDYPRSVAQAIVLSIDTAEAATLDPELDAAVVGLLNVIAMLSPAGVQRVFLPESNGRLDQALERCTEGSLLSWSSTGDTVIMHRLIARVIRERAESVDETTELVSRALDVINSCVCDDDEVWQHREEVAHLVAHVGAIWETGLPELSDQFTAIRALKARGWAVRQLIGSENTARSLTFGHAVVSDCERVLGLDHPQTLTARDHLARAYFSAGQHGKVIPLCEATLADRERVLGPDDPQTLLSRSRLADAYLSEGEYERAMLLYQSTLADRERVLGSDDPQTLLARVTLATFSHMMGKLDDTATVFSSVLADCERILGQDHTQTLSARRSLAVAYESTLHFDKAVPLFEAVLSGRERVLGPDHPQTLRSRDDLAHTYESLGQLDKVIVLREAILFDRERVLGPDHPDTLASRDSLASAYSTVGQVGKAIPLFEKLLSDRERVLGPDHRDTLASRSNLAEAYGDVGEVDKALSLQSAVLADLQRVVGPDSLSTLTCQVKLVGAYIAAEQLDKAISLTESILIDCERLLGPDQLATLAVRVGLAVAYSNQDEFDKGIRLSEATLADCERALGPEHPVTLAARRSAILLHSVGQQEVSIPLIESIIADYQRVLGPYHPDTFECRGDLAHAYYMLGQLNEAIADYQAILSDCQRELGPDHPVTVAFAGQLDQALNEWRDEYGK